MESHIPHSHRLWLYILVGILLAFLILPSLLVVPMSFNHSTLMVFPPQRWSLRWYQNFLNNPTWFDSFVISLKVAVLTMIVATPIGVAAAYSLHVGSFRFRRLIEFILTLPMLVPVILMAIGLFFVYARFSMINSILGLVLAYTLLSIPFVLITVAAGLKTYDMSQEMVARSLGASWFVAFFTVTLPQIKLSVISGALFAFIIAFDEVVIAQFLSGGSNATLTKVMFASVRDEIDPTIAAVSTILLFVTILPPMLLHIVASHKRSK
ncbi:ABC transporter permease [Ferrovibrio sp.]|uniref:ABC transporter permease n=1 Tax=Ferrovibrio sp. TaxID=1917215 RepID=UPI0025BC44FA|nr:ABC transporter permease [Ferrovibrio sp.]MBX3455508.1 ABC transporter permease [Ferrovibrio sp.]